MATTITLPENLEAQLQQQAAAQHRSVEAVALDILRETLDAKMPVPTVEDVVAKIKATSPNPHNIRPANGSLATALRRVPGNIAFDLGNGTRIGPQSRRKCTPCDARTPLTTTVVTGLDTGDSFA